jgi:endoglucanase
VLVAYNIPDRDCGGYSAGGATSAQAYAQWIQSFAAGIGSKRAIVILEPDALADIGCLSPSDQSARLGMLSSAVQTLKSLGNTSVYIDAGNPNWIPAATMAQSLKGADISAADGFAVNVSNFYSTSADEQYGNALSALVGGKHYVIDTSRNGDGPDASDDWCNPSGRALGAAPTSNTGSSLVDYFLWIKPPGESDGTCNGGPSAGTFWPQYALGLLQNAGL